MPNVFRWNIARREQLGRLATGESVEGLPSILEEVREPDAGGGDRGAAVDASGVVPSAGVGASCRQSAETRRAVVQQQAAGSVVEEARPAVNTQCHTEYQEATFSAWGRYGPRRADFRGRERSIILAVTARRVADA